jgi:hypothetical protein
MLFQVADRESVKVEGGTRAFSERLRSPGAACEQTARVSQHHGIPFGPNLLASASVLIRMRTRILSLALGSAFWVLLFAILVTVFSSNLVFAAPAHETDRIVVFCSRKPSADGSRGRNSRSDRDSTRWSHCNDRTHGHMHVHLEGRKDFGDAPIFLAHGITTVLNLRGFPGT